MDDWVLVECVAKVGAVAAEAVGGYEGRGRRLAATDADGSSMTSGAASFSLGAWMHAAWEAYAPLLGNLGALLS